MKVFYKKHYQPDDPMWVVGCIDSYGSITARVVDMGGDLMHTQAESRGIKWRWNVWGQEFIATRNPSHNKLSKEEHFSVSDCLERNGYKMPEE